MVNNGDRKCWKKDELSINLWKEIDFDDVKKGDLIKLECKDGCLITIADSNTVLNLSNDKLSYFMGSRVVYLDYDPSVEESIDILETRWSA